MDPMNPTGAHRPKRRHHGEGTVVRRKDHWRAKPWVAVVPWVDESGRRRQTWLSAASRDEAEQLRRDEVARIRKGVLPSVETVGSYMTAWLATVDVGPGTWPRYQQHLSMRIIPTLGDTPLASLAPQQVRTAMLEWSGSPATRGGTLRLLRAAMTQAVHDRRIEHDPTAGIPYPRIVAKPPTTLTAEQARHLIATSEGEPIQPFLVVSLGLGLRRGETLGLRTPDVDLVNRTLHVGGALRYISPSFRAAGEGPYRITGTKTGQSREIPMPRFVADALAARIETRDQEQRAAKVWAPNDFVFCDDRGNAIPKSTLAYWFAQALKRAGLPPMRLHELRATTVTLLYELDVPEAVIMSIVGHADLQTTRLYKGKTPRAMDAAAVRLDEAIG